MALNPPLAPTGEPFRIDSNEFFILNRRGIEFEVKVEGLGKMSGKGVVRSIFLKIVFLLDGPHY